MNNSTFNIGSIFVNTNSPGIISLTRSDDEKFANGESVLWAPDTNINEYGMKIFSDIVLHAKSRNLPVTVYYNVDEANIARYNIISLA